MRDAAVVPRVLLLSAACLGLLGCSRGCVVLPGERRYESIDGAVKVELVRSSHGPAFFQLLGQSTARFHVRVHTKSPIDFPVDCSMFGDHVDLAENASGTLVALRCRGERKWTVLRLRSDGGYLYDCAAPVGTGPEPAFDTLDPLSRGADRIIGCTWGHAAEWTKLTGYIEEDEGAPAAAAFLARTALLPVLDRIPWQETFDGQTQKVRAATLREICPALSRGEASAPLYARAARNCSLDDAALGEAAVSHMRRFASEPGENAQRPDAGFDASALDRAPARDLALGWASVIAVAKAPDAAGSAACAMLPSLPAPAPGGDCDKHPSAFLLSVIAATKTPCPAAERWVKASTDAGLLRCEDRVCTPAEIELGIRTWTAPGREPLTGGKRAEVQLPSCERARRAIENAGDR